MKKVSPILMCFALVMSMLTACGENSSEFTDDNENTLCIPSVNSLFHM